jgi:hypothetical protein
LSEFIQNCSNKFRFQREIIEDVNAAATWNGGYDEEPNDDDYGDVYGYGKESVVQLYWLELVRQDYGVVSQMVATH